MLNHRKYRSRENCKLTWPALSSMTVVIRNNLDYTVGIVCTVVHLANRSGFVDDIRKIQVSTIFCIKSNVEVRLYSVNELTAELR